MQQNQRYLLMVVVLGAACIPAMAGTITYRITVDTSSAAGVTGYVGFDLSAGSVPPILPVNAAVSGYEGGTLIPGDPFALANTVNVTGALPGVVTMDNSTLNAYTEKIQFGDAVSFFVTLAGTGVNLLGGAAGASATDFQLGFFDTVGNPLFSTDPSANVAVIDVAPNGLVTPEALPNESGGSDATLTVTPEPATLTLLACAGMAALVLRWRASFRKG
jgi:hypothetical protein